MRRGAFVGTLLLSISALLAAACTRDSGTETSWQAQPEMSIARSEHPAAVLDGAIYVFGGLVSTAQGVTATTSVERYLMADENWDSVADLPEARHHSMATSSSGQVFLLGGFDGTGFNPVASTWRLDPSTNQWSALADIPVALGAGAVVSLDGLIYLVGGVPAGTCLFAYDPSTGIWEQLLSMSSPREHIAAVAHEDKIWVLGGRWEGAMLQSVEIFDPATGTWSAGPDMLEARSGFGAAVVDDSIIVAGGEVFDPTRALDSVEIFDGSDWRSINSLPVPLHGLPLAAVDGQVFALSGSRQAAGVDNTGEVWSLDR